MKIKKCYRCKVGRVVVNRKLKLKFCSYCGHEFKR